MKKFLAVAVASFSLMTAAQASLLGRNINGGAVAGSDPSAVFLYDTTLNVTWLANANLAASEDFGVRFIDPTGYTDAVSALKWIGAMNAADYLGFNNWRLPTTLQPDPSCSGQDGLGSRGLNCRGGEMGHLFYDELGGTPNQDIATTHNTNYGLFQNFSPQVLSTGPVRPRAHKAAAAHGNSISEKEPSSRVVISTVPSCWPCAQAMF